MARILLKYFFNKFTNLNKNKKPSYNVKLNKMQGLVV